MSETEVTEILAQLRAPFDPSCVKWRLGATNREKTQGMALAYADRFPYIDRLDAVLGMLNWHNEFHFDQGVMVCKLSLKINGEWHFKSDTAGMTEVEGEKGAATDSFKRACVIWGPGRYLYEMKKTWVDIEAYGKSYRIKSSEETRLHDIVVNHTRRQVAQAALVSAESSAGAGPNGHDPLPPDPEPKAKEAPAEKPAEETRAEAEPITYVDMFEMCCERARNGKVDVIGWLKKKGDFPGLNAVPKDIMQEMFEEFVGLETTQ